MRMITKGKSLLLAALVATALWSCDSDDNFENEKSIPQEVRNSFAQKYPSASNTEWTNKGVYEVAEFTYNNIQASAWFDSKGTWHMTETDLSYSLLPQAIKDAFQASEYNTWKIDDVDMLERKGFEPIYVIEVELQENEIDLYFSAEGILIKTIVDNDNSNNDYENHLPETATTEITSFIEERYPQSRIVEIEREKSKIEVDIIHNNLSKEVIFNNDKQWLYTSWDVRVRELPQAVSSILNTPQYIGYHIDDAEYIETAQGDYYLLELEKGDRDVNVKVDINGNILN